MWKVFKILWCRVAHAPWHRYHLPMNEDWSQDVTCGKCLRHWRT